MRSRMIFGEFVDKAFYALITGVALFCATRIDTISKSIDQLNQSIAGMIVSDRDQGKTLDNHEERIQRLEHRGYK